jgi:myo-inositol 2-dehydrogenase / D-chiro-inositol 1-dehydrogenase
MKSSNGHLLANRPELNRRKFLATTGVSAVGLSLLRPETVFGAEANSKINVGLIGCGGRGQLIAEMFQKNGGFNVAAVADYFQDRADAVGGAHNIPANRRFTGLSAYKRLLEQKLDAVMIESPPYFHPEQAAAAVDAGKHVYLAKPVGVDVPGCVRVADSGRKATEKRLAFLVDFQTRTHPVLQEFDKRIRAGEIGRLVSAEASYLDSPVGSVTDANRRADPTNPELRLRSWVTDRNLSGDIITEQNIHSLDMACWYLDAAPLSAYGTGGKKREFVGDCWDHFSVIYEFPKEVVLTFDSKQVGFGYSDIMCRVFGDSGTVDAHYFGKVMFKSKEDGVNGDVNNLYVTGIESNVATFHKSITEGDFSNPTVASSVRSNLTTILGRTAAYHQTRVSWEEMMKQPEHFVADLKGLKT